MLLSEASKTSIIPKTNHIFDSKTYEVSLVISGIVVSLVIPYSSPFFRKKIPEKVVKNIREKSGKNPEKS